MIIREDDVLDVVYALRQQRISPRKIRGHSQYVANSKAVSLCRKFTFRRVSLQEASRGHGIVGCGVMSFELLVAVSYYFMSCLLVRHITLCYTVRSWYQRVSIVHDTKGLPSVLSVDLK